MIENKNYQSVLVFIFLSYILVSAFFYLGLGGQLPNLMNPTETWKTLLLMYTPAISAYLTSKIFNEKYFTKEEIFGLLNRWHLIALFLPLVLMILSSIISLIIYSKLSFNYHLTGAIELNQDLPWGMKDQLIEQMKKSPLTNLFSMVLNGLGQAWGLSMLFALGEELGWRGYLLKKLAPLGFWPSVFIIGPVWGLWHFPLILKGYNYPTNPKFGVLMMMISCTAITPIMIYLRNKAKSVWAAAIFHGSFNSFISIAFMPIHGDATSFEIGFLGISGIVANLLIFFLFKSVDKNNVVKKTVTSQP